MNDWNFISFEHQSMFFFSIAKVVSKILPFRKENKKLLDPIWNSHHIERIEIVLKETLDAKGTGFELLLNASSPHQWMVSPFVFVISLALIVDLSFIYRADSIL